MGQAGQNRQNKTATTGLPGQGCQKTASTRLPVQIFPDMTSRAGQKEEDSKKITATTGQPEGDSQNGTARIGQLPKGNSQNRTTKIGLPAQDYQEGQLEKDT
jgi:hypothetical protein